MPKTPTLENYISVFKQVPVFHYMLNTLVVCLISIFGNVVSPRWPATHWDA